MENQNETKLDAQGNSTNPLLGDENPPMNKEQAIEAMRKGKKITHRFFMPKEYIYMEGECVIGEDGISHGEFFWFHRKNEMWSRDWRIFFA